MADGSNADKLSLSTFMWEKRIVILSIDNSNLNFLEKTKQFIENNLCEFNDRNLEFISFQNGFNKNYQTPTYIKNQNGFWLVGYDGQVKLYSKNLSFLSTFFDEIDTMPMRIDEMSSSQNNC
jgi:hypothetical protein